MPKGISVYTLGGTVQAGSGLYIERDADDELLELCRAGELAFILSSRQIGKSSLMVRTAEKLREENIFSATVDLSAIGVNVTPDEWYLGILNELASSLELNIDIFSWWNQRTELGQIQRLTTFFREVLLKENNKRVVLFFDEIDSTLGIPFSDDFFAALRAIYNARSTIVDFKRLSFVLIGVATPSDLISSSERTPFNIGKRVELSDFTREEAKPLVSEFGEKAEQVLEWVLKWTSGHPYLTQRLCAHLAKSRGLFTEDRVDIVVDELFIGEGGWHDNNLQFVRDMLTRRAPSVQNVIKVYKKIRSGKQIADDEHSTIKSHLKLSGVIRSKNGVLIVRNKIYETIFNINWIKEVAPPKWMLVAGIILSILILIVASIFYYDYVVVPKKATQAENCFYNPNVVEKRLSCLADLFKLKPIFNSYGYDERGREVFFNQPNLANQLAPFEPPEPNRPEPNADDLIVVIRGLYIAVADVNSTGENTILLARMRDALARAESVENKQELEKLESEIGYWVDARASIIDGNLEAAFSNYTKAIVEDSDNPSLLLERGKILILEEDFRDALNDFDLALASSKKFNDSDTGNLTMRKIPPSESTSDSIKSVFSTHTERVSAIRDIITREETLWPFLQTATANDYPNLAEIGIIPFSPPVISEDN